jgi:hypothetical protein
VVLWMVKLSNILVCRTYQLSAGQLFAALRKYKKLVPLLNTATIRSCRNPPRLHRKKTITTIKNVSHVCGCSLAYYVNIGRPITRIYSLEKHADLEKACRYAP